MNEDYIKDFMKKVGSGSTSAKNSTDTRYQYPYVELEEVISNPSEYIIPQCLPACKSLWSKNIETFMVSNNDDNDLYVLLSNVSPENMAIFREMQKRDPRFVFDGYRRTIGIAVKGTDESSMQELEALTEVFRIQDTLRFKKAEDFLEEYKHTGGKMVIEDDGTIRRDKNPDLENATLQEALEKTGKSGLYVLEEGRIYESPMYLQWHRKYQQSLQDDLTDDISSIATHRENMDGRISHLRDVYLASEREYVAELLRDPSMRKLISEVNQQPSDLLFETAQKLVDDIEAGSVPEEKMAFAEKKLTVLLASIQDRVLTKDLVLTPDFSEKLEVLNGRSR